MFTLAESVSLILTGLKATIARIAAPDRSRTAYLVFIWGRISRTVWRFERLYARWKNGTLPKPRAPRPASTRAPRPAEPQLFRLPKGRAWLLRELQHYDANGRASQFRHLLATSAELAEFLKAAPQAARLLNPICRMLGAAPCATPGATPRATPRAMHAVTPGPTPATPPAKTEPTPSGLAARAPLAPADLTPANPRHSSPASPGLPAFFSSA